MALKSVPIFQCPSAAYPVPASVPDVFLIWWPNSLDSTGFQRTPSEVTPYLAYCLGPVVCLKVNKLSKSLTNFLGLLDSCYAITSETKAT